MSTDSSADTTLTHEPCRETIQEISQNISQNIGQKINQETLCQDYDDDARQERVKEMASHITTQDATLFPMLIEWKDYKRYLNPYHISTGATSVTPVVAAASSTGSDTLVASAPDDHLEGVQSEAQALILYVTTEFSGWNNRIPLTQTKRYVYVG